jgi:hypothetical protein
MKFLVALKWHQWFSPQPGILFSHHFLTVAVNMLLLKGYTCLQSKGMNFNHDFCTSIRLLDRVELSHAITISVHSCIDARFSPDFQISVSVGIFLAVY